MCKGETFRLHLDVALSASSWMPLSQALSVELRAGPFVNKPLCVRAGILTLWPGACVISMLEIRLAMEVPVE